MSAPYLGTVITGTVIGGTTYTQGTSPVSITIVTTGTYLFSFSVGVNTNITAGTGSFTGTNKPASSGTTFPATNLNQATFYISGSVIVQNASGVYGVNINTTPNTDLLGGGNNFGFFTAVRIG